MSLAVSLDEGGLRALLHVDCFGNPPECEIRSGKIVEKRATDRPIKPSRHFLNSTLAHSRRLAQPAKLLVGKNEFEVCNEPSSRNLGHCWQRQNSLVLDRSKAQAAELVKNRAFDDASFESIETRFQASLYERV